MSSINDLEKGSYEHDRMTIQTECNGATFPSPALTSPAFTSDTEDSSKHLHPQGVQNVGGEESSADSCWSQIIKAVKARLLGRVGQSQSSDHEPLPELRVRSLDSFPRPTQKGYNRLATFQDSDPAFMVYRRFGYVSTRLILDKQDELRRLEENLDQYDNANTDDADTTNLEDGPAQLRSAILGKLEAAYASYASLLINAQQLMSLNRPSDTEHKSVFRYLEARKPIHPDERTYILHKEDLVTLRPGREHAWLDRTIEAVLKRLYGPMPFLNKWFCTDQTRKKCTNGDVIYTSPERVNHCATVIVTLMILALLIVPIYLLYAFVGHGKGGFSGRTTAICIGILLVFTLAFSAALSLFTRARRHEILGAAAAYCAVLVVFLGNVPN